VTVRFFEDFQVGDEVTSRGQTITESSIIDYATQYDPQFFHTDVEAAAGSPYGGLIASGWQTVAIGFRLFIDTNQIGENSLGSPGCDELRWLKPVRPGDTLHTVARILELRPSSSRPDRGTIVTSFRMINQRGEDVLTLKGSLLVKRRPNPVSVA